MVEYPPEITCAICHKPLKLHSPDMSVDENGKAVHSGCYLNRILVQPAPSPPRRSV
jgi:hypothetical protein